MDNDLMTRLGDQEQQRSGGAVEAGDVLDRVATWLWRSMPRLEWNLAALSTLGLLCRRGPLRLGDLVAAESMSQPGMTGLVSRLEAAGLLSRAADPTDGRAILVSATAEGHALLDRIHAIRADLVARHVSQLSDDEQAALAVALPVLDRLASQPPEGER